MSSLQQSNEWQEATKPAEECTEDVKPVESIANEWKADDSDEIAADTPVDAGTGMVGGVTAAVHHAFDAGVAMLPTRDGIVTKVEKLEEQASDMLKNATVPIMASYNDAGIGAAVKSAASIGLSAATAVKDSMTAAIIGAKDRGLEGASDLSTMVKSKAQGAATALGLSEGPSEEETQLEESGDKKKRRRRSRGHRGRQHRKTSLDGTAIDGPADEAEEQEEEHDDEDEAEAKDEEQDRMDDQPLDGDKPRLDRKKELPALGTPNTPDLTPLKEDEMDDDSAPASSGKKNKRGGGKGRRGNLQKLHDQQQELGAPGHTPGPGVLAKIGAYKDTIVEAVKEKVDLAKDRLDNASLNADDDTTPMEEEPWSVDKDDKDVSATDSTLKKAEKQLDKMHSAVAHKGKNRLKGSTIV